MYIAFDTAVHSLVCFVKKSLYVFIRRYVYKYKKNPKKLKSKETLSPEINQMLIICRSYKLILISLCKKVTYIWEKFIEFS